MKYVVDVNGIRRDVMVDGLSATIAAVREPAVLSPANGTSLRLLKVGDRMVRVMTRRGEGKGTYTLDIDGYVYTVEAIDERTRAIRDMTAKSAASLGPAPLKAPMPGLIVRVNVAVGDQVQAGQGLVVMEAMKMENELRASVAGVVKAIHAVPGAAVEKGALLVELAE
jgi:biotin carboxyl carrier protein